MKTTQLLLIAAAALFGIGCTAYVDPTPPVTTESTVTSESTHVPGVGTVTERTTTTTY